MVRNLFVLSLVSFTFVGCFGPKKGPSPVTDGGLDTALVAQPIPASVGALAPDPAPAPAAAKKGAAKSKGKLPISNAGNK